MYHLQRPYQLKRKLQHKVISILLQSFNLNDLHHGSTELDNPIRRDTGNAIWHFLPVRLFKSDTVFLNWTQTRLDTDPIGCGLDRTHSVALRHGPDCTQIRLRTNSIKRNNDRKNGENILVDILVDDEKISVYISTRNDFHLPSPPAKGRIASIIVLLLRLENLSCR